jgi:hypothetical protein
MPFSVPSTLEKHMRKCVVNNAANPAAAAAAVAAAAAAAAAVTSGSSTSGTSSNNGISALSGRPASNGSNSAANSALGLMNGLTNAAAGSGLLGFGLGNANSSLLLSNQLLNMVNSARNSPAQPLLGATASNLLSMGYGLGAHGAGNEVDA